MLAPYWVSYPEMVKMVYGIPVIVTPEDGTFQPRLEEVEEAVSSYTKAIILNSPNNPSGKVYDGDWLRGLVQYCEERDIYVMMDDIYHRLVFDGRQAVHCYDCTDRAVDDSKVIVLNGVSKQYAMTGFRIGWAVGPRDLIQAMANIQSHQSGGPCSLSQKAAVAAIEGAQGTVGDLRRTLEISRNELMTLLGEIPGLKADKPEGTFYCLADFRAFDEDSTRMAARLLDKIQVVTVPGIEFGMEGFLRLSYCGSIEDVREGVRRIKWLLDENGTPELLAGEKVFSR